MKPALILIHGLGRNWRSMQAITPAAKAAGFEIHYLRYPSTRHDIATLTERYLSPLIHSLDCSHPLFFITHSLGGILLRQHLQQAALPDGSRIVMLGPPNHGSEVAQAFKNQRWFQWLDGPAGQQLGTDSNSLPLQLKPIDADIGIIAGTRNIYWPISHSLPKPNDGLVSVASTHLQEMQDHLILPVSHGLMMRDTQVITQGLHFLEHGVFDHGQSH